jgi:MFS family permease
MRLSLADGCAFALMVGIAETYVIANGVALSATPIQLALLIAAPLLLGGLGPALVLGRMRRGWHRRPIAAVGSLGQAGALAGMSLGNLAGAITVGQLIAWFCLYHVCGQGAGTAWSSWYGDLVPADRRGRYFARRSRLIHLATFLALVAGGLILQALEPGRPGLGFATTFAVGAGCRLASAAVLFASPEPRLGAFAAARTLRTYFATRRGRAGGILLLGSGLFQGATYLASPFFAPFMLDDLQLDYLGYMAATGMQAALKFLAMPVWGRLVDSRSPQRAYLVAVLLSAVVPVPWLWIDGLHGVLWAQALSGFAWGGYEVALFTMMLHSTRRSTRPHLYSTQTFGNAVGQCAGSLGGAEILAAASYPAVFAASAVARVGIAFGLAVALGGLPRLRGRPVAMVLRVVGYRPGTGVVHRPIEEPTSPAGDQERAERR